MKQETLHQTSTGEGVNIQSLVYLEIKEHSLSSTRDSRGTIPGSSVGWKISGEENHRGFRISLRNRHSFGRPDLLKTGDCG